MKHKTGPLWSALVAFWAAIIGTLFFLHFANERLETCVVDTFFSWRGAANPPFSTAVLKIDDKTYRELGHDSRLPMPRYRYTELLRTLAEAKVGGVVLDVMFNEPSSDPEIDQELAQAMRAVPVVLPIFEGRGTQDAPAIVPLQVFRSAAAAEGAVDRSADLYAVTRTFPSAHRPLLGVAAARLVADVAVPTPRDYINFYGPSETIRTLSFSDVLKNPGLAKSLRGKVVIIGYAVSLASTAVRLDAFPTPFGMVHGAEIHATIAENLLSNLWLHRFPQPKESTLLYLAIFLGAFAIITAPLYIDGVILVAALGTYTVASFYFFLNGLYFPGLVTALLIFAVVLGLKLFRNIWLTHRARNEIRRVLSRVVAKPVMQELLKDASRAKLGGARAELTMMLTDITGFSTLAEPMDDQRLFALLSRYFSEIYPITLSEGGAVLNFVADALAVVWGAPLPAEDGCDRAIRTAVAMQSAVKKFCERENIPLLKTRVGIDYGKCAIGNFGTEEHFTYTAIGDHMNLAARLEGLNKHFGTVIMVSSDVKDRLKGSYHLLRLGLVRVPGRRGLTEVYGVFLAPLASDAPFLWQAAWDLFRQQEWSAAEEGFRQAAAAESALDTAAAFYLHHIALNRAVPPPADWQGAIALEKDDKETIHQLLKKVSAAA